MTQDQAHELLISYGFDCFKSDICWYYYLLNSSENVSCINLLPLHNKIIFKDCCVYRTKDDSSFGITFGNIFFSSGLDEIDEDYLKMEIEEYLLKYKKKIVEIQKLELDKEFS